MNFKTGFCRCLWLPALLALPAAASAGGAEVHEYRLENGLKLLVKEDHRAPVVVSQVWYRVGSSYEHDGITGVSHVLEHMMFQGTESYPGGEFSKIIAENGGRENAFTSQDYTAYFQILEKSRLEVSLRLEADRMRNLLLLEEDYEKEAEVVKEERRMRTEDRPVSYLYEVAQATAFQTSPYRHPIVGWMADLESLQAADLEDWYRRWYAPNNAVLVVVGAVEHERVEQLVRRHFGPLEAAPVAVPRPRPEIPQQGVKRVVVKRVAEVPHLLLAYKTPVLRAAAPSADGAQTAEGQADAPPWEPYALEVLAGVLDGGISARLETNLVRGQEAASSIGVSYDAVGRLPGLFVIQGAPARGKTVAELEAAVMEQLEKLKYEALSEEEMARVKAQVVSGEVYERDSLFYQAMVLGVYETAGLSWRLADQYAQRLQAVTPAQVQSVARRYFQDDGLTIAVLDPQPAAAAAAP